jgi:hypothetical protein
MVVLALALSAASVAQSQSLTPLPPQQAAGKALMQCVAHSLGMGPIAVDAAEKLRSAGLQYVTAPPPHLRAMTQNEYGRGSFAMSPSVEGQVWAVGYDSGVCIVMTLGAATGPVERRMNELFAIPNSFKREAIKQLPGARWSQWRWSQPERDLVAQMSVREISNPAVKGSVMVTLAPARGANR